MSFVHLHVHSVWSLMAGVPTVDQLVARAGELGMPALALTDTNRTSGLILFYEACLKAGIRPILGVELDEAERPGESVVLLARNVRGYGDLCELATRRMLHARGFSFREAFASPWPDLVLLSAHPRCLEILAASPNRDSLYGELVNHDRRSRERSRAVEAVCAERGLPLAAANDCHLLDPGDWELHRMLRAIDLNGTLSRLEENETAPRAAWLCGEERMRERFPRHAEALENTARIAAACDVRLELGRWIMPEIATPPGSSPDSLLAGLARQGLWRNYAGKPEYGRAREIQEMELATIRKLGYSSYFLMVKEIRDWANDRFKSRYRKARDCTILRGSAANSITFYNLDVGDLDPIRYDLYFQRFLNEDRASPPDADLDFGWDEREIVLDHVAERFGRDRVAVTCTTHHFRGRAAFREAAKVLGFSEGQASAVLASHETRHGRLEDDAIAEISAWARRIEGRPRFLGQHPGGVLITNDPIRRHVGCEWSGGTKNRVITQIDMHNGIDALGLIKFDLLGNGSLSVFRDTLAQLEEQGLPDPGIGKPDGLSRCFEDEAVRTLIRNGRTRGVFYIESPAQTRLNKKADAATFEEIAITSSLVRPAGSAYTRTFVERHRKHKLGIKDWDFLHPALEPLLRETHDVCAYQEDVTKVCHHVAGLSYRKSDRIRKMMNSQHEGGLGPEEYRETAAEFIAGCMETNGLSREQAAELWKRVASFTGFSFCKSHSASYAQLSFQCAWLKSRYPAQFLSAVIGNNHGYYERRVYLDEARRWGLRILPIDINASRVEYHGAEDWIRPGFLHIRGLGGAAQRRIVAERGRGGPYRHLPDFLSRTGLGKAETEKLILAGACDAWGLTQPELLFQLQAERGKVRGRIPGDGPGLFDAVHGSGQGEALGGLPGLSDASPGSGQDGIPADRPIAKRPDGAEARLPELGNYSLAQRCFNELDLLGYMLSGNLLSVLELHPGARHAVPAAEIGRHAGGFVKVFGTPVTDRVHRIEASGRAMKFLTLQDHTECVDVLFWPDVFERYEDLLLEAGPFEVWGKVTEDWGAFTVEATRLRAVPWSPNTVDYQLASEKLRLSRNSWKRYADLPGIRAA